MSILQEFKEFAMKGNVLDMAVGVIIGGAFGKIVTSVVGDVLMPAVGMATGGVDFKSLEAVLKPAELGPDGKEIAAAVVVHYGNLMQTVFDFLIVALCVFMLVKGINQLKKPEATAEEAPAEVPAQEVLLAEIRDLLKAQAN